MSKSKHVVSIICLMLFALVLLGRLVGRADVIFADGVRYIEQAERIARGSWSEGFFRSIDHPLYPLLIAIVHGILGDHGADSWQTAAQGASVLSAVLLVIPLYLLILELFDASTARLSCIFFYLLPVNNHVFADALSESSFLLFWTWGVWSALRYLRAGRFAWLPVTIGFAALAYLSRPEGLLLPAAVLATLLAAPLLPETKLNRRPYWSAIAFFLIGGICTIGPYVMMKGGLGTKPAIARILGNAPNSPPSAVERKEPLDPEQTTSEGLRLAVKAVATSYRDAVGLPLWPFAIVGIWASAPFLDRRRVWLFLAIIEIASAAALTRLHTTGGYCTARHAMIPAMILIAAASRGVTWLVGQIHPPGSWRGVQGERLTLGPAIYALIVAAFALWYAPQNQARINQGYGGFREAGAWIDHHVPQNDTILDVTGWSLFYAERPGYTFSNLGEASLDPSLRWIVVRDAHLVGPWEYCKILRKLSEGLEPVASFPPTPTRGKARVLVFDRKQTPRRTARAAEITAKQGSIR